MAFINSVQTNAAALLALQSLGQTEQNLQTTENQVSTGYAVNGAADNAGYFSIATQLKSDNSVINATNAALAQSQAVLTTAATNISSILTTISSIQSSLTQATSSTANIGNINQTLTQLGNQLVDAINGASFNGVNLLNGSQTAALNFVAGFNATTTGGAFNTISLSAQTVATGSGGGTGILGAATATDGSGNTFDLTLLGAGANAVTSTNASSILSAVFAAQSSLTNYAATIGTINNRIQNASNLNTAIQTNYSQGISALVDADLNQASTRLQALQTQQQLGIQSLSIANQNSQLILKLFP